MTRAKKKRREEKRRGEGGGRFDQRGGRAQLM